MEQYTQFQALEVPLQLDMILLVAVLIHVLHIPVAARAVHAVVMNG